MKIIKTTIHGGGPELQRAIDEPSLIRDRFGVMEFGFDFEGDVPRVEAVLLEWAVTGEDAEVTMLMPDDHAERFAVQLGQGGTDVRWEAG